MRRAGPHAHLVGALLLPCLVLAGCGGDGGRASEDLTFETLPADASLTEGRPDIRAWSLERISGGPYLARGEAELPDGARVRIARLQQ